MGRTPSISGKRVYYYDTKLPSLVLSVTSTGTRSFLIYKKIKGKPVRHTLGRFPAMTVEQARREGQKILGQIAAGIDPLQQKKASRSRAVTLAEVFEDFLQARKSLKPVTLKDYQPVMKTAFVDWQKKLILKITKDIVAKRHRQLVSEVTRAQI